MIKLFLSGVIFGGITFLIFYIIKNTTVIDKTDPSNTQLVCDLKQLQARLKK